MMKSNRFVFCLAVLFGMILCFTGVALAQDISRGESVYRSNCTMCHLIRSEDPPISAYYREFRPKDFTTPSMSKNLTEEKIKSVLTRGQGNMRPVYLSQEDYKALIDYLINDLRKHKK